MSKARLFGIPIFLILVLAVFVGIAAAKTTVTQSPVGPFPETGLPPGPGSNAMLQRTDDGVKVTINTSGLYPGEAYTVWWVVWNDPSQCTGGCGEDDLGVDGNSVFWATGKVIPNSATGAAHFSATVDVGSPKGQVLFGPGLTDAHNAEIHVVMQGHGPPSDDPGILHAQLNTFKGGWDCATCQDHQAAVFLP